jgi:EPS-associated MarR family transcriptional regulator
LDINTRYRLLKLLDEQPHLSQRELARAMGISLGKTNFCLQALIKVGLVKAKNFRNSKNKAAYLYKLTPGGIEEKARVTRNFLQRKIEEYESIQREIAEIKADIKGSAEKYKS